LRCNLHIIWTNDMAFLFKVRSDESIYFSIIIIELYNIKSGNEIHQSISVLLSLFTFRDSIFQFSKRY